MTTGLKEFEDIIDASFEVPEVYRRRSIYFFGSGRLDAYTGKLDDAGIRCLGDLHGKTVEDIVRPRPLRTTRKNFNEFLALAKASGVRLT